MNALEDHPGEIVRKARLASNLDQTAAAQAADLQPQQLADFESSGRLPQDTDVERLAHAVGLHPRKLQYIAEGWLPAAVHLSRWQHLRQITSSHDSLTVHCYLVWDEITRDAALFDTGWDADKILAIVNAENLNLCHLFLTHSHDDHMSAMGSIRTRSPSIKIHTSSPHAPPQHKNRPNDFIHLGNLRITHRPTPGHSEDSTSYIVGHWPHDAPHAAFTGDSLFAGSLATGFQSWPTLRQSVQDQLFSLPDPTLICPGHGPITTVLEEKEHNPFFD